MVILAKVILAPEKGLQVKLLILPLYNVYQRVCIPAEIQTSKLMQCLTSENINATKMCKFSRA